MLRTRAAAGQAMRPSTARAIRGLQAARKNRRRTTVAVRDCIPRIWGGRLSRCPPSARRGRERSERACEQRVGPGHRRDASRVCGDGRRIGPQRVGRQGPRTTRKPRPSAARGPPAQGPQSNLVGAALHMRFVAWRYQRRSVNLPRPHRHGNLQMCRSAEGSVSHRSLSALPAHAVSDSYFRAFEE